MLTPLTLQGHLGSAEAPRLRSRATTAMAQFSIAAKWKELADEAGWPEERSTPALHGVSVFASERQGGGIVITVASDEVQRRIDLHGTLQVDVCGDQLFNIIPGGHLLRATFLPMNLKLRRKDGDPVHSVFDRGDTFSVSSGVAIANIEGKLETGITKGDPAFVAVVCDEGGRLLGFVPTRCSLIKQSLLSGGSSSICIPDSEWNPANGSQCWCAVSPRVPRSTPIDAANWIGHQALDLVVPKEIRHLLPHPFELARVYGIAYCFSMTTDLSWPTRAALAYVLGGVLFGVRYSDHNYRGLLPSRTTSRLPFMWSYPPPFRQLREAAYPTSSEKHSSSSTWASYCKGLSTLTFGVAALTSPWTLPHLWNALPAAWQGHAEASADGWRLLNQLSIRNWRIADASTGNPLAELQQSGLPAVPSTMGECWAYRLVFQFGHLWGALWNWGPGWLIAQAAPSLSILASRVAPLMPGTLGVVTKGATLVGQSAIFWLRYNCGLATFFVANQCDAIVNAVYAGWSVLSGLPIRAGVVKLVTESCRGSLTHLLPRAVANTNSTSGLQFAMLAGIRAVHSTVAWFPVPSFVLTFPVTSALAATVATVSTLSIIDRLCGGAVLRAIRTVWAPTLKIVSAASGILLGGHALSVTSHLSPAAMVLQFAVASLLMTPALYLESSMALLTNGSDRSVEELREKELGLLLCANGFLWSHACSTIAQTILDEAQGGNLTTSFAVNAARAIAVLVGITSVHGVELTFEMAFLFPTARRVWRACVNVIESIHHFRNRFSVAVLGFVATTDNIATASVRRVLSALQPLANVFYTTSAKIEDFLWNALVSIVTFVRDQIVLRACRTLWRHVLRPALDFLRVVRRGVIRGWSWAYTNILVPTARALRTGLRFLRRKSIQFYRWIRDSIIVPTINRIVDLMRFVKRKSIEVYQFFRDRIVLPTVNLVADILSWLRRRCVDVINGIRVNVLQPIWRCFRRMVVEPLRSACLFCRRQLVSLYHHVIIPAARLVKRKAIQGFRATNNIALARFVLFCVGHFWTGTTDASFKGDSWIRVALLGAATWALLPAALCLGGRGIRDFNLHGPLPTSPAIDRLGWYVERFSAYWFNNLDCGLIELATAVSKEVIDLLRSLRNALRVLIDGILEVARALFKSLSTFVLNVLSQVIDSLWIIWSNPYTGLLSSLATLVGGGRLHSNGYLRHLEESTLQRLVVLSVAIQDGFKQFVLNPGRRVREVLTDTVGPAATRGGLFLADSVAAAVEDIVFDPFGLFQRGAFAFAVAGILWAPTLSTAEKPTFATVFVMEPGVADLWEQRVSDLVHLCRGCVVTLCTPIVALQGLSWLCGPGFVAAFPATISIATCTFILGRHLALIMKGRADRTDWTSMKAAVRNPELLHLALARGSGVTPQSTWGYARHNIFHQIALLNSATPATCCAIVLNVGGQEESLAWRRCLSAEDTDGHSPLRRAHDTQNTRFIRWAFSQGADVRGWPQGQCTLWSAETLSRYFTIRAYRTMVSRTCNHDLRVAVNGYMVAILIVRMRLQYSEAPIPSLPDEMWFAVLGFLRPCDMMWPAPELP